ncbi:hypothetical protein [Burkholderia gladioli]|uniref:hypothetical protein n=1 Tax=Burkholderia gladioli TaxID=28095 RepID=UPI001FC888D1|nr:hypothetical protein [Burkholderia gladioli]
MSMQHIPAVTARPAVNGNQEMQLAALRIAATIETLSERGFTIIGIQHSGGCVPTIQIQSSAECAQLIEKGDAVYFKSEGEGAARTRSGQFKVGTVRVIWVERGH